MTGTMADNGDDADSVSDYIHDRWSYKRLVRVMAHDDDDYDYY